jgi:hypothetical protein
LLSFLGLLSSLGLAGHKTRVPASSGVQTARGTRRGGGMSGLPRGEGSPPAFAARMLFLR